MNDSAPTIDTPDGPFTVITADDGAVLASGWTADADGLMARIPEGLRPSRTPTVIPDPVATAVWAYYSGDVAMIDTVVVRQQSTEFRSRAWLALRSIPAGAPCSYTEFAVLLGSPKAVRAAAGACANNTAALFIPCHRVLRSDGSLGGFGWGLDVKRSLLEHERRSTNAHSAAAGTDGAVTAVPRRCRLSPADARRDATGSG